MLNISLSLFLSFTNKVYFEIILFQLFQYAHVVVCLFFIFLEKDLLFLAPKLRCFYFEIYPYQQSSLTTQIKFKMRLFLAVLNVSNSVGKYDRLVVSFRQDKPRYSSARYQECTQMLFFYKFGVGFSFLLILCGMSVE